MASAYGRRSGRRIKSEINVVPYIDVMLVLLVIFMVTAPLVTPSVIDLPTVGQAQQQPAKPIEINLAANGDISVRDLDLGENKFQKMNKTDLISRIQARQASNPEQPVVIGADRKIEYQQVVNIMGELQAKGIKRVGLLVKQGS